MGDVVAAVDRYKDIPVPVRAKLKARMQVRNYDEIVTITREAISGEAEYASQISAMHFGAGSVCGTVTRAKWTDQMQERVREKMAELGFPRFLCGFFTRKIPKLERWQPAG